MKKLLFLSALIIDSSLLLFNSASAQAPSGFTYQSVLRDANNDLIINTTVGTQISILQTTAGGTAVYVETHTASTNANGLLTLQVGGGAVQSGTFGGIDWSAGPYFIKSETDPAGGTTYTITGTQQMMSVPYALYAQSSGSSSNVNWTLNSGDITAVGTTDVIATSSLGVGSDLTSGFDFGANTIVLRENNTRILFEDSSTPGGTFPSTDWRLTANDQANGGENYFSIDNVTDTLVGIKVKVNGTLAIPTPGAQLGIGTDNPALSIHAKSGNTPSIRLEQDVSGGYSSEIWDIIANEVTFAVRNSSRLPFKISPDALSNSLVVTSTGVGVGTQNPLADLHVNGSLLARQATIDTIYSTSGLPLRLMARGIVAGSTGSTAPGQYASAMGSFTSASGDASIAMGSNTTASGGSSTAMGYGTTASGLYSTAMGYQTTASGSYSTAMGYGTKASGDASTAMGLFTTASGFISTAMGSYTNAPSYAETAVGSFTTTYTPASTTAWNNADRLFVVGNGTSSSALSNAMVVLKNGNTGIGVSAPTYTLQVNGEPAAAGYTQFTNYSDARLKTNISDLESSLEKIMALRPISYNYNETYLKLYNDPTSLTKVHKGFIAQEIKEVFPEMVGTVNIEGTEYFDLNLSNLPVYTIKAIQEQQALIQQLLQRIEHLENR